MKLHTLTLLACISVALCRPQKKAEDEWWTESDNGNWDDGNWDDGNWDDANWDDGNWDDGNSDELGSWSSDTDGPSTSGNNGGGNSDGQTSLGSGEYESSWSGDWSGEWPGNSSTSDGPNPPDNNGGGNNGGGAGGRPNCTGALPKIDTGVHGNCGIKNSVACTIQKRAMDTEKEDHARIVGGIEAQPCEWPWQALLKKNGDFICGGTLISNQSVVTAAHCIEANENLNDWEIHLGEHNRQNDNTVTPEVRVKPCQIIKHSQYTDGPNDIALIRLSVPVNLGSHHIQAACVPPQPVVQAATRATAQASPCAPVGTMCTVTGWGTTKYEGEAPNKLHEVEVKILEDSHCENRYGSGYDKNSMCCAGYVAGGKDSCQGDSGGPLVCKSPSGRWFLAGVVSYGDKCALANAPGVYTKVSHFVPWIKQHGSGQ